MMMAIKYQILLEEPVLATSSEGDPNSRVSYPYIPGSSIRGLLVGLVKRQYSKLATEARDLFFNGKVRYLHAYPAQKDGKRSLPVPLSWHIEKKKKQVKNEPIEDHVYVDSFCDPKPLGKPFVWLNKKIAQVHEPNLHITVHTARDRKAGRPTDEVDGGALYRYVALAAGQRFAGAILVEDHTLGQEIQRILQPGVHYLGGVQSAGYGRVLISDVVLDEDWQEYESEDAESEDLGVGKQLVVTLLSDTILRNEYGATHTDIIRELGLPVEQSRAFKKITVAGGFNRTWGMPLNKDIALKAGSVFVLQAKEKIAASQLQGLQQEGIGERSVEGYGRLVVNWQQEDNETMTLAAYEKPSESVGTIDLTRSKAEVKKLASRMVNRKRRRELENDLINAAQTLSIAPRPSNNQLSRVRVIARNALQAGDLPRISLLFKRDIQVQEEGGASEESVPNEHVMRERSLRQFEAAQIGIPRQTTRPLSDWLIALADDPTEVWKYFARSATPATLGGIQPDEKLAKEYAVRLIDAMLAKAIQKNQAQESGEEEE